MTHSLTCVSHILYINFIKQNLLSRTSNIRHTTQIKFYIFVHNILRILFLLLSLSSFHSHVVSFIKRKIKYYSTEKKKTKKIWKNIGGETSVYDLNENDVVSAQITINCLNA